MLNLVDPDKLRLKHKSASDLVKMVKLSNQLEVVKLQLNLEPTRVTVSHRFKAHPSKKSFYREECNNFISSLIFFTDMVFHIMVLLNLLPVPRNKWPHIVNKIENYLIQSANLETLMRNIVNLHLNKNI